MAGAAAGHLLVRASEDVLVREDASDAGTSKSPELHVLAHARILHIRRTM